MKSQRARKPPTPESVKDIDAALLDEEEDPGSSGDEAIVSPGRSPGSPPPADSKRPRQRARGYNELKTFKGQIYSGMAVGGSHTWNYDQGVWHETKEEPDFWKIDYKATKRRTRNAPKGSGAPVGTEYHWLIVAHQVSKQEGYPACHKQFINGRE